MQIDIVVSMTGFYLLLIVFTYSSADSSPARRIYGGKDANIQDFPYHVQIVPMPKAAPAYVAHSSCGGAIIAPKVVLTAGHCTNKGRHRPKNYLVRAGTSYRNGYGGSLHRIADIKVHESYVKHRRAHSNDDISVIYVDPPFTFDEKRRTIAISITSPNEGTLAWATGFGYIDVRQKQHPEKLQSSELMVIPTKTCNEKTRWKGMIDPTTFCAGGFSDKATCKGDSGGPLVYNGKLIGLVSWGFAKKCVKFNYPTVFINVTQYIPWIQTKTENAGVQYL